jgi:hypothetical protein
VQACFLNLRDSTPLGLVHATRPSNAVTKATGVGWAILGLVFIVFRGPLARASRRWGEWYQRPRSERRGSGPYGWLPPPGPLGRFWTETRLDVLRRRAVISGCVLVVVGVWAIAFAQP